MMETIQQLIDKSLVRPPRIRSGKFSPSSFGRCFRQQYWNRKDEPQSNPPDERALRVFQAGSLFHDFVQQLLMKDNSYEIEAWLESDDVKGCADMVSENEIVDIKSQHSKSFWWMTKSKDIKKDKYSNWLQVMYYARELKKDFGRLVFISKDDLCIQEYVEPLDGYWLRRIEIELSMLRMFWEQETLPPAEPRCEKNKKGEYWECNYCSWRDKCKKLEEKNEPPRP